MAWRLYGEADSGESRSNLSAAEAKSRCRSCILVSVCTDLNPGISSSGMVSGMGGAFLGAVIRTFFAGADAGLMF